MVDIEITPSDEKTLVARFMRKTFSEAMQRDYMATDIILVIGKDFESNIRKDFDLYRQLECAKQAQFIEKIMALPRYIECLLSSEDLPKVVVEEEAKPEHDPQTALF